MDHPLSLSPGLIETPASRCASMYRCRLVSTISGQTATYEGFGATWREFGYETKIIFLLRGGFGGGSWLGVRNSTRATQRPPEAGRHKGLLWRSEQ